MHPQTNTHSFISSEWIFLPLCRGHDPVNSPQQQHSTMHTVLSLSSETISNPPASLWIHFTNPTFASCHFLCFYSPASASVHEKDDEVERQTDHHSEVPIYAIAGQDGVQSQGYESRGNVIHVMDYTAPHLVGDIEALISSHFVLTPSRVCRWRR